MVFLEYDHDVIMSPRLGDHVINPSRALLWRRGFHFFAIEPTGGYAGRPTDMPQIAKVLSPPERVKRFTLLV